MFYGVSRVHLVPFVLALLPTLAFGQEEKDTKPADLKKLSIEELMDVQVTTVSKRPEKLSEVASAIQVITSEEIKRSGATCVPEALRLSSNLQVAQYNSHVWIITARGFNNVFSNKLLVMIDGRTVYTPLFAGVYWDIQSVLLEDVERIEVISGPGGSLWGANAVNGIINIITKSSADSKGLYASVASGNMLQQYGGVRYGGSLGSKFTYRAFVQTSKRDKTYLAGDTLRAADNWMLTQGGVRIDYSPTENDQFSAQANVYGGLDRSVPGPSTYDGQNALARWSHTFSPTSDIAVQAYFDRTWRKDLPSTFNDQLTTYDLDLQHHFQLGRHHNVIWGGGYRMMRDRSQHSTDFVGFIPIDRNMPLYSGFIQDEITVVPDVFKVTVGSKVLHNVYTGFEYQPSARINWMPAEHNTIWASVSRAVRTPSRIDVDYHIPTYQVPPGSLHINGGPNFASEKVIAYELGYRIQAVKTLSASLAAFYNQYDDLYTVEPLPGTLTYEIQNGIKGNSKGVEATATFQPFSAWKLKAGYTTLIKDLRNKPGHSYDLSYAGSDPRNQFTFQSMLDLPAGFQLDLNGRLIDDLPLSVVANSPRVPSYFNYNARIAWQYKSFEISVVGQNLASKKHSEFASTRIQRSGYIRLAVRL